jgi:NADH-quinone oxidoreductase subunit F
MKKLTLNDLERIKNENTLSRDLTSGTKTIRINVHTGTCGIASGALKVFVLFKELIEKNTSNNIDLVTSGCAGLCNHEPMVTVSIGDELPVKYINIDEEKTQKIFSEHILNGKPFLESVIAVGKEAVFGVFPDREKVASHTLTGMSETGFYKSQMLVALKNRGVIDPEKIDEYIARDGYQGVAKALLKMTPQEIIDEVKTSGIRGRGGAGFPAGFKWQYCHDEKNPVKYMLCNADEGDPGAFMDRSILESDPHAVLEGLIIGGKAIGSSIGYIYVRAEYPLAIKRLKTAISQATEYGLLGEDILGSGFSMDIQLYFGAGAFVCGEETALMRSIEGKRGMPRPRPPFPAHKGLWDKPSVLNNVETLANVPLIIMKSGEWFSSIGTKKSTGTKVFAMSGKVNNIGLIEVPMGISLKTIIYDIGGGIPDNKQLKAVQIGGPSGGCVPASLIDTPVDYESIAKTGAIVGSGGMVVIDESQCMVDVAKFFLGFTAEESCGKCSPCREGTYQLLQILEKITSGYGEPEDLENLESISKVLQSASLCGLGQTVPNPVLSTLKYFRDEYEKHIYEKHCPVGACKRLSAPPCQSDCPMGQDVSTYISLIGHGRIEKAYEVIKKQNPLPMILGRVCPHPCESSCKRNELDKPVSICAMKRLVADSMRKTLKNVQPKKIRFQNKPVAIIGSGPAGLSAANALVLKGYPVTIFEKFKEPGGMLRVGIPSYRLPRDILDEEIGYIIDLGVEILTNTAIGQSITISELKKEGFKSFFLATGAHIGRKLNIPGEGKHISGFIDVTEFLRDVNFGDRTLPGKNICIIGGGNCAIDAARTLLRLGAEAIRIIYRREQDQMPANRCEIIAALEEGIKIDFLTGISQIQEKKGRVSGIYCTRNRLGEPDSSGRRRPVEIEGSEFFLGCDTVISAIGQFPDIEYVKPMTKILSFGENRIQTDKLTLETGEPGFFAGGDLITGPATVAAAIEAGNRAAVSIDCYLQGRKYRGYWKPRPQMFIEKLSPQDSDEDLIRPENRIISLKKRKTGFSEVELGIDLQTAIKEARRCLRCDL